MTTADVHSTGHTILARDTPLSDLVANFRQNFVHQRYTGSHGSQTSPQFIGMTTASCYLRSIFATTTYLRMRHVYEPSKTYFAYQFTFYQP